MSPNSSPQSDAQQPTYRRLKLVMSTPEHSYPPNSAQPSNGVVKEESSRSSSPARPSYSPVTPTLSHSSAAGHETAEPEWTDEPAPLPMSLDENVDAIALQATLSLLQMQRQQSLKDIRALNQLKQDALEDPEAFVKALRKGELSKPSSSGISFDSDVEDSGEEEKPVKQGQPHFGKLPIGQNIARCPPIEWSKYRIAGEPLDRLHELQRQYPGITEEAIVSGLQPQSYEVAAPYRPFTDKVDAPPLSAEKRKYDG